jgi:uncharacterized protein (DUF305 family)
MNGRHTPHPAIAALLLPLLIAAACATAPVQQDARTADAATPSQSDTRRPPAGYTPADVRFMQGMIGHHAQALVMTALVAERTSRQDFALLAERIEVSQKDEIAQMQRWLRDRSEEVPSPDAHVHAAMGHGELMPGMLTQQELDALRDARGVAFERLFLQLMIRHHDGALVMVRQLFDSPGAGREPEVFIFASDVDADQTAEIQRLRRLLDSLPDTRSRVTLPPAGDLMAPV